MQAVLLAAGESSRFFPLNTKHKSLIPIAGEPLIVHTIRAVKRAGITDIILVTGKNRDFQEVLSNGRRFGVKIRYIVQENPTGAGDALLLASNLIVSDFFLVNSNHVEFDKLKLAIDKKRTTNKEAILLGVKESSGQEFGAVRLNRDQVIEVSEKPRSTVGFPKIRIVGVYFLNRDFINTLRKVPRAHYSLENALDLYAKERKLFIAFTDDREVLSLKYPWDLLNIKNYILRRQHRSISKKAVVSKSAQIEGNVVVEEGAQILENAIIKGPSYIGKNAFIGSNCLVRDGSDIEESCAIGAYMEVKNSLILERSKTHSGFIGDSVIGPNARIGALFGTANVRLDRKNVIASVKNRKVDSGLHSLGVIIGENVLIGERVSTMPGIIIGNNVRIGPSTTVMKNLDSDMTYYTKFKEFVEKNPPPKIVDRHAD